MYGYQHLCTVCHSSSLSPMEMLFPVGTFYTLTILPSRERQYKLINSIEGVIDQGRRTGQASRRNRESKLQYTVIPAVGTLLAGNKDYKNYTYILIMTMGNNLILNNYDRDRVAITKTTTPTTPKTTTTTRFRPYCVVC